MLYIPGIKHAVRELQLELREEPTCEGYKFESQK